MAWEPYTEKYFFRIDDIWNAIDGDKASGKPSRWKFTTEGL